MKNIYSKSLYLILFGLLSASIAFAQVSSSADVTSGCKSLTVNFTASASGGVTYSWFFGDGAIGLGANTTYTYTKAGKYYPYVYAYDGNGFYLGADYSLFIDVYGAADSIDVSNRNPCPNDIVILNLYPTSNMSNVTWIFGDGSVLTNKNYMSVEHKYSTAGVYWPKAIVTTSCGIDTLTQKVTVGLNNPIPPNSTYFQLADDTLCPNDAEYFYLDWKYANYVLNFGDGNYTSKDYEHSYSAAGTYPVSVTYTNGCGKTLTLHDTIRVLNNYGFDPNYPPNIYSSPDSTCINAPTNFYGYPDKYQRYKWEFNNNINDTLIGQSVTKAFTSIGYKKAKLTITNGCGVKITVLDSVKVKNNIPILNPELNFFPDSVCPGSAIMYDGDGNGVGLTYSWDFGDGYTSTRPQGSHTFNNVGNYTVKLTILNACGSSANLQKTAKVMNALVPDSNLYFWGVPNGEGACVGDSLIFVFGPIGTADSVYWWFGDGDSTQAPQTSTVVVQGINYSIIKHAYDTVGIYSFNMKYTNGCGNSFTGTKSIQVGTTAPIEEAGFFYDQNVYLCQDKNITFYAYGGSTYIWNFGDGTGNFITNTTFAPVLHAYNKPGSYPVTCKIINGCGNFVIDSAQIKIPESKIHITTNTVSPNCGKNDGKAIVVASGGTLPYQYQWSSGHTTFIADSLVSGIYVVNVTDKNGCSNFGIATLSDKQAPTIAINAVINVSCYGDNNGAVDINLIGNSAPYSYLWSNGATTQDINQLVAGPYELVVKDANNCMATKSILIAQPPALTLTTLSSPASCNGGNDGNATVSVNGSTAPYTYLWNNGQITPTAYGLSAGIYTVNVIDKNGCIYDKTVAVNEDNAPIIVIDSMLGTGCQNNLIDVYTRAIMGTAPYTYSWSTGATTSFVTGLSLGNYKLTVKGNDNCKAVKELNLTKDIPKGIPICMVSVDTVSNTNQLMWYKDTSLTGIAGYNIYKESSMSGLYYKVGFVDFDSLSLYVDHLSDPQVRSWRYKISVVDDCNNESSLSYEHKTIHLTANQGLGGVYNLIWDHYEGFKYTTYNIYRYDQANGWQQIATLPNNLFSYTDATPPSNTLAYRVDAVANFNCTPTRIGVNTSKSNIKNVSKLATSANTQLYGYNFNVYPNPSEGLITIDLPYSDNAYSLKVYNLLGELVYNTSVQNKLTETLDLSALDKGMYTITISNNQTNVSKKIILQ